MHFLEPIILGFKHTYHVRPYPRIGSRKVKPECADGKIPVAGHTIHVGIAHDVIHDPRRFEVALRVTCHAGTMFGPFMLK